MKSLAQDQRELWQDKAWAQVLAITLGAVPTEHSHRKGD